MRPGLTVSIKGGNVVLNGHVWDLRAWKFILVRLLDHNPTMFPPDCAVPCVCFSAVSDVL